VFDSRHDKFVRETGKNFWTGYKVTETLGTRYNVLDEACKEHDIAYSQIKALKERHKADSILIDNA